MSRLPILMSMPRLTLTQCRPVFSLLRSCNNGGSKYHNAGPTFYFTQTPSLFNNINTLFTSKAPTPFYSTLAATSYTQEENPLPVSDPKETRRVPKRSKKLQRNDKPEFQLKCKLDLCSKRDDLEEAVRLFDGARVDGIPLAVHHYNVLLYLCSNYANTDGGIDSLEKGFEIFRQMGIDKVVPNEATFTSLARLAAKKKDPEMAFDLVKQMKDSGMSPKLRSYGPALYGFCEKGDADGAYRVDDHMVECGVVAEEPDLAALLKVSVDAGRVDKVYEMLHRLRACVRQVSEETATIVEDWFTSETASGVGIDNWDVEKVKKGVVEGGGGWHGQGWLGSGKWKVAKAEINKKGVCSSCGEKLVCIDIDPAETVNFASSLMSLACGKEKRDTFLQFKRWLVTHGPFDAVVDGANVGLSNSHSFNYRHLYNVVDQLRQISPSKKLPLVILHRRHVYGGPAESPYIKRVLDSWREAGALYATPHGSNDDWYWLYAAVSCKCLLVTNDEMRDHLFQLLGDSIFPRWKEKHQVRMTFSRSGLALHMPPLYSIVTQESEGGSWHVPTVSGDDLETPRKWLCATRATRTRSKVRGQLSNLFPID